MQTSIFIAVPTFKRLDLLTTLLEGLARQDVSQDRYRLRAIVFDNDAARTAEAIVSEMRARFPFQLEYVSVIDPGLASVRNSTLSFARDRCDYLAMIDDDECPEPQWLSALLDMQRSTGAEVVVGPVPPILPDSVPRWVHEYRARELPAYPDGSFLKDGWSGNCLLDMRAIEKFGLTFDRALDFAGGEDQLFFRQIVARGGRIAYAAHAVAWEDTPPQRRSLRFLLVRSFRRGNTLAHCDRRIYGRLRATVVRSFKGLGTIARGIVKTLNGARLRNASGTVDGACDAMSGLGMLCGLFGLTYQAYRRPVPDSVTVC